MRSVVTDMEKRDAVRRAIEEKDQDAKEYESFGENACLSGQTKRAEEYWRLADQAETDAASLRDVLANGIEGEGSKI